MRVKFIYAAIISTLTLFASSCGGSVEWNIQQRQAMRQAIEDYRQMVYLANLPSEEFALFSDGVVEDIELDYPIYTEFIKLPAVNDTIDLYVVSAIVSELQADVANMRYLMPYEMLVSEGELPEGLSRGDQVEFYRCMAGKVNANFMGFTSFVNSLIEGEVEPSQLNAFIGDCSMTLFNWSVTIIEE